MWKIICDLGFLRNIKDCVGSFLGWLEFLHLHWTLPVYSGVWRIFLILKTIYLIASIVSSLAAANSNWCYISWLLIYFLFVLAYFSVALLWSHLFYLDRQKYINIYFYWFWRYLVEEGEAAVLIYFWLIW